MNVYSEWCLMEIRGHRWRKPYQYLSAMRCLGIGKTGKKSLLRIIKLNFKVVMGLNHRVRGPEGGTKGEELMKSKHLSCRLLTLCLRNWKFRRIEMTSSFLFKLGNWVQNIWKQGKFLKDFPPPSVIPTRVTDGCEHMVNWFGSD